MSNTYQFPMASIGGGVILHYKNSNGETTFLMQERTNDTYTHQGLIGVAGCYPNLTIKEDGSFELPNEALRRRIAEEFGERFRNVLPLKCFSLTGIAMLRPNTEPGMDNAKQANFQALWVYEIDEATAELAEAQSEVANVVKVTMAELAGVKNRLVPWFMETLTELQSIGKVPK